MKFRLFIGFFFCLLSFTYVAQKGQIIGKVVDEKSNSPILYVTVSLHNYLDTSLIMGVITDLQGKFKIQNVVLNNSYLLKCSFIGYETYFKRIDFEDEKSIYLGDIFISPSRIVYSKKQVRFFFLIFLLKLLESWIFNILFRLYFLLF